MSDSSQDSLSTNTEESNSKGYKVPSDYCTVCNHSDILKIGEVLDSLVVYEQVDGLFSLAYLDGGDHIEPKFHTFKKTPRKAPPMYSSDLLDLAEELEEKKIKTVKETDFIDEVDKSIDLFEDWIDIHIGEIVRLTDAFNLTESISIYKIALNSGYSDRSFKRFNVWLYRQIAEVISQMYKEDDECFD
jgi:hypothetical protein